MSYQLQLFEASELPRYRAFLAGLRNVDPKVPDDRRQWFIFSNPLGGACAVAHLGDELAARCYISGRQAVTAKGVLPVCEIGDTGTEPQHQRKGLFSKLVKLCRDWAFDHQAKLVYGTPNAQSSPGYEKLGFGFVYDSRSHLLFTPTEKAVWTSAATLLKRSRATRAVDRMRGPVSFSGLKLHELSFSDYAALTIGRPRFNAGTERYLQWRLADSTPRMRFFRCTHGTQDVACAARPGLLGGLTILVIAEHFDLGTETHLPLSTLSQQALVHTFYAGYDGVYSRQAAGYGRVGQAAQLMRGAIRHRMLPICYAFREPPQGSEGANLMATASHNFQLSDCDIG